MTTTMLRTALSRALGILLVGLLAAALLTVPREDAPAPAVRLAASSNPVTPGNFTGYGFDQCQAPAQAKMDAWLAHSRYLAAGIYISGNSRFCKVQTYLNPTWVSTQLAKGWKLLPITLGPQANCNPKFPRYGSDPVISAVKASDGTFAKAAAQGKAEADKTVSVALALGLVPGSTMYYDLEAYNIANSTCRVSALTFLSAWTKELHAKGYVSGVYSSAGSGIKAIDALRTSNPRGFTLPDQLWIADWDKTAGTSSRYISSAGWQPHSRIKQYQGGHDETHGGVTINIDRDYVNVGKGTVAPAENHCGISVNYARYYALQPLKKHQTIAKSRRLEVRALKCLLRERGGYYRGKYVSHVYNASLQAAVRRFRAAHHLANTPNWNHKLWIMLLASPDTNKVVKIGSGSAAVRDLQRALNAANPDLKAPITGVFTSATKAAVKAYQKKVGLKADGIAGATTWAKLAAGAR